MTLRLVLAFLLLAACSGDAKDSGPTPSSGTPTGTTSGAPTGTAGGTASGTASGTPSGTPTGTATGGVTATFSWTDDGQMPQDTDGDGLPDFGCGDLLDIVVTGGVGGSMFLGMAEGGPNGWTGEDCFNGYAGWNYCHPIGAVHQLIEVPDCSVNSVVAGSSTLFDSSKHPYLTFYLEDANGCYVRGFNRPYYAGLGCTELL